MNGPFGKVVATIAMKILELDKANFYHNKLKEYKGPDFAEHLLKDLDIKLDIKSEQLDYIPVDGPFITISNHHYGSIDGLILSNVVGHARSDFKILTNYILSLIPAMSDTFMPVNPFTTGSSKSFKGLKMALTHVSEGGGLGLFPAGEVATYQHFDKKTSRKFSAVEDIPWPENMIRLIRNAKVPVVPIYFEGTNSRMFHILGKIHPRLRTARLVHELFNKRHRTVSMRIGKPVSVSEIAEFTDNKELGGYLRSRVYVMESEFIRQYKKPAVPVEKTGEQIALPHDKRLIIRELKAIRSQKLFTVTKYDAFLSTYDRIPNTMLEIGRLREEAFRGVGEGTGNARDLDEYDRYYHHLILWDNEELKIVGAYRLGIGTEIWPKYGRKGFYTSTLFDYRSDSDNILPWSIELGRSFVNRQYQKENLPLLLLFKGLMHAVVAFPEIKYFIGPVSISNEIPRIYKSLMMYYLYNRKNASSFGKIAVQTCPFRTEFNNIRPEDLLRNKMDSVDKFDRFILNLSDGAYRMPPLVKKYYKCGALTICYNVDPLFNYALDCLILLPISTFPKDELLQMLKSAQTEEEKLSVLARFGY